MEEGVSSCNLNEISIKYPISEIQLIDRADEYEWLLWFTDQLPAVFLVIIYCISRKAKEK